MERSFVVEQNENLQRMPQFAGERFSAMARGNAVRLFRRFADIRKGLVGERLSIGLAAVLSAMKISTIIDLGQLVPLEVARRLVGIEPGSD